MQIENRESITLDYFGVKKVSEIEKLVKQYFERLKKVYKNCQTIKVKILNLPPEKLNLASENKYLVSISLKTSKTEEIYILRQPKSVNGSESAISAITETFAMLYRKLIEDKLVF